MSGHDTAQIAPRGRPHPRPRVPSGPRGPRDSTLGFPTLRSEASSSSLASRLTAHTNVEPLEPFEPSKLPYTTSPEASPDIDGRHVVPSTQSAPLNHRERGRTITTVTTPPVRESSKTRSSTTPLEVPRPSSPAFSFGSRSGTPSILPPAKAKPKPSRLQTDSLGPPSSPTKPVSPGLKHWQQVRQHVLAPSPVETHPKGRTFALMTKAVGKFGLRQGPESKRHSTGFSDLPFEEQEAIARERRRFAKDIRACLDACALDESRRRLQRSSGKAPSIRNAPSVHGTMNGFDFEVYAFAPLLIQLSNYLPFARRKEPWARTCPHHGIILAELGQAFVTDTMSSAGDRMQALEIFGLMVRHWSADNADEEVERWTWLLRAMLIPDRTLRNRAFTLLDQCLHADSSLPRPPEMPHTASQFQTVALELLTLLHAIESRGDASNQLQTTIDSFIRELANGDIIPVSLQSIAIMLGEEDLFGDAGGLEKELLWVAVATAIGVDPQIAKWLLSNRGSALQRFVPPPILHATPPMTLQLRSLAICSMLSSMSKLVLDADLIRNIWTLAKSLILPEAETLPDIGKIACSLGQLIAELELQHHRVTSAGVDESDPFRADGDWATANPSTDHREFLMGHIRDGAWKAGIEQGVRDVIMQADILPITRMLRSFLSMDNLNVFSRQCVNAFFERICSTGVPVPQAQSFLKFLQKQHPQILYKPLFALSASTSTASVTNNLRTVHALSASLGKTAFWTQADPQMIVIVLAGDASPKKNKGKGKEGESELAHVKMGRYACLLELIDALEGQADKKCLRSFGDAVETRFGAILDAEQREASIPQLYRRLLCQLFLSIRGATMSARKVVWQRLVLGWYLSNEWDDSEAGGELISTLQSVYTLSTAPPNGVTPSSASIRKPEEASVIKPLTLEPFSVVLSRLLVAVHTFLSPTDWLDLLPIIWDKYCLRPEETQSLSFLLMKCAEQIPSLLRDHFLNRISDPDATVRLDNLHKLATIYGWRHQVLSGLVITDRRGPVFQFAMRTLDFVATEIGTPNWAPSQDVQDAALNKFGTSLPLELRQRLMDLGWTDDQNISGKSDWADVPISKMPSSQLHDDSHSAAIDGLTSSPTKSLRRRGSSASGRSASKRMKAVFPPLLVDLIAVQASLLSHDVDLSVCAMSRELVHSLQRDDPAALLRTFTDNTSDYLTALTRLNALIADTTPGFAYLAMNAIIGHLKTVVRNHGSFAYHAEALTTVSRLIPSVSQVSLRDVRKNKAEHVLLPASIHEEEGGFKLHPPWQDGTIPVQTAQLLVLTEILRANPRDVYLVKKMLFNLQIQISIADASFARAWLLLVSQLFSVLNRNYTDRAELRHFLSNVANILRVHGQGDIFIPSHAIQVLMLCSARFRRLFASIGVATVMRSIYDLFRGCHDSPAILDCVTYAMRSFYRIHGDAFVHQTVVVIADGDSDPKATYDILACLATPNGASSGISSGLKGVNDKEELEALVQVLSGPELSVAEVGQDASQRLASKMAHINLDARVFPQDNIVRLFVTIIAANPAIPRAINFMRLLGGIISYLKPQMSLLQDSMDALGSVIAKAKVGNDAAKLTFLPYTADVKPDWTAARRAYVSLVEAYARSGGHLSPNATRRTLDMVLDLLNGDPVAIGSTAASIVHELARTRLSSDAALTFLRDIAPLFRQFIDVVDFSGFMDEITSLIDSSNGSNSLGHELVEVIVDSYVDSSIRMLARAAEDGLVFSIPLRSSTIKLIAGAAFLPGADVLSSLEQTPATANVLASLVFPLVLELDLPEQGDHEAVLHSLWIRLLRYVVQPWKKSTSPTDTPRNFPLIAVLTLQITKLVSLRAPDAISEVKGLWQYLGRHLTDMTDDGDGLFYSSNSRPRLVDWMLWTTLQLVVMHSSPFRIHMQHRLQMCAIEVLRSSRSQPSSPVIGRRSMSSQQTRRSPSGVHDRLSPSRSPTHSRNPSNNKKADLLAPDRSISLASNYNDGRRASFTQKSKQLSTRPSFETFAQFRGAARPRFPSSVPMRSLGLNEKGIVHMTGSPITPSSAYPNIKPLSKSMNAHDPRASIRAHVMQTPALVDGIMDAVDDVLANSGVATGSNRSIRPGWSTSEALSFVTEQIRLLIEEEFREVFNPPENQWVDIEGEGDSFEKPEQYSLEKLGQKYNDEDGVQIPILQITTT